LTRRANQGHIDIIADIVEPAPENRQRAFQWRRRYPQRQFQVIEPVSSHFPQFVNGSKRSLTRRANQGHINIIAKIHKARAEKSAVGFFVEISESDGGRTSRRLIIQPVA
jgi:riboflavin synthase alpha subunit